jgi:hypothetical protein
LNPRHFVCFTFIFVSCGELCLIVSWCAGDRCDMEGSDENRGMNSRPDAEDRDGRTGRVFGGRMIGRSGDVVCDLHRTRGDEEHGFLS